MTFSISKIWGRAAILLALFSSCAAASEDIAAQAERARQLMAAHEFEQAIPICRELVNAEPGNPGLLLNLALAEHMAGHEKESIPHFEAVLRAKPDLLPALISLGAARLGLNQPAEAVGPLNKAISADPKNTDARGMLADALAESGHFDEAAAQFRKLTELTPQDARAWYGLGTAFESIARATFDRMQKMDAESPYALALAADTRVQKRQYRSAFFFYKQALDKAPDLHGVHAAMAEVYRKTGHSDWASAEDAKERALTAPNCKLHPAECDFIAGHDLEALKPAPSSPSVETLYWRVRAANELAMQAFFQLGELPPSPEMHELKARIARDHDQHLESVKEWKAALDLAPNDPRLEQELAVSYILAGDYQSALKQTAKLLDAGIRSPELDFTAGDSLLRLEQPEKAIPYLEKALSLDPRMIPAEASLGLALARAGRPANAIPHLEKALALDDDGSLHYQLARALQSSGQAERARTVMAQYQDIVAKNEAAKQEVAREAQIAPRQ